MPSISPTELEFVHECIARLARGRSVVAACLYGSRVAGYSRPDSDIDLLLVLERFAFGVSYTYIRDRSRGDVSALVIDKRAIEADATKGMLGEFVIGRLLHVYEPLQGSRYLTELERAYKKRVILEETKELAAISGTLCTELAFPLEYIHFSKIKRRSAHYPSAAYSYYKTYSGTNSHRNLGATLLGYERSLEEIRGEDPALFESRGKDRIGISERSIKVEGGTVQLKLSSRLKQFGSYLVHTYAGLKVMHRSVGEAESKLRRRTSRIEPPLSISDPVGQFCTLPEGQLIAESSRGWIDEYCLKAGIGAGLVVSKRTRLGNSSSQTRLLELTSAGSSDSPNIVRKLVVKSLAVSKSLKWSALNVWTAPVKRYSVEPLVLLGTQYKGLRFLKHVGLRAPKIEAIVLDRKLVVTQYIEGVSMAQIITEFLKSGEQSRDNFFIEIAGEQISRVHSHGASFGNLKPKNILLSDGSLYFTELEQFSRDSKDQAWDIAQFLSWALKRSSSAESACLLVRKFFQGYLAEGLHPKEVVQKLAGSRRHLESFYPVLTPQVALAIKNEIKRAAK
ncbi:MAG: nucleotidyltransferase domain-containing protein [Nitrososphaera sp.]